MSSTVIRVENLSKRYVLGTRNAAGGSARYDTFRDALVRAVRRPFAGLRPPIHESPSTIHDSEFWALRDVSFDVKRGEVLGIIGRNGAGKSTLLKILSRITEPTSGRVSVKGRVASLLEVGTGFHPELSGRENIFLNGVILGMTRAEVQRRFDEIVAFAEVEKFLDTAVKHYSSGMYVRLAFAVAAHLDPEILIVDEVLAVGDAAFQEKCLRKIRAIAESEGKTVLLVSHQLATIEQLCSQGLLLSQGQLLASGTTRDVAQRYREGLQTAADVEMPLLLADELELKSFEIAPEFLRPASAASFTFQMHVLMNCTVFDLQIILFNAAGERMMLLDCRNSSGPYKLLTGQTCVFTISLPRCGLNEGVYSAMFFVRTARHSTILDCVASMRVGDLEFASGVVPYRREYTGQFVPEYSVKHRFGRLVGI